ncbi:sensor histidine kinase [Pseudoduganella aquatica]|uniref:sensor histidine kinase n=1 Tax=Pseudoduganella aquatica TaxID=2660641 RepID=UPI001E6314EE|nr:histidine kinase [Pseudoduganella aquatica]
MFLLSRFHRVALAVMAAVVCVVFAGLEWLTNIAFGNGISTWGMALGIACSSLLFLGIAGLQRAHAPLRQAAWAALAKSMEMALGATFLFVLVAAASFLPVSLTSRFMLGDRATDTIIYLALGLGILLAVNASIGALVQRKLDQAEARAEIAERDHQLLQAEMAVLRAQIEPHFLWNTLAHVQFLARKSPDEAADMTGNLITYLRAAVPGARRDANTLGSELASVRAYLDIMRIRMGQRLQVEVEMESKLAGLPFPPLIVQTLVENAIKHGVEPKPGPVSVRVLAQIVQEGAQRQMVLCVSDTGVGLRSDAATVGTGLGLVSVRTRLQGLYAGQAVFTLAERAGGGVEARVVIAL